MTAPKNDGENRDSKKKGTEPPIDRTVAYENSLDAFDGAAPGDTPKPMPNVPGVTLQREIARGGMGVVYVGRQDFLDRTVAVKLLSIDLQGDEFSARFQREAKLLAGIKHTNIVACHDAGVSEEGLYYLVMEYIDGPTLKHWLANNGPFPAPVALDMCKAMARALDHAHAQGVIHRDVKPENILLETVTSTRVNTMTPFVPKLVDLGLARMQTESAGLGLTSPGAVMGTPMTMSPEQFDDPDTVDFRTDIYGLGCVLFEMLTGKPAFAASKLTDLVIKKREPVGPNPCEQLDWLPERIGDLVTRMLAADREDRPESYAALCDELDKLVVEFSAANQDSAAWATTQAGMTPPPMDANELWKSKVDDKSPLPKELAQTQGILRSSELNFLAEDMGGDAAPVSPFSDSSDPPTAASTAAPAAAGKSTTAGAAGKGKVIAAVAIVVVAAIGGTAFFRLGDGKDEKQQAQTTSPKNEEPVTPVPVTPAQPKKANKAPTTPEISAPATSGLLQAQTLRATSTDPDADEIAYRWSSTSKFVTFSPQDAAETSMMILDGLPGQEFVVEVQVDDRNGHTASTRHTVELDNFTPRAFLSGFVADESPWQVDDRMAWTQNFEDLSVRGLAKDGERIATRGLGKEAYWHLVGFVEPTRFRDPKAFGESGVRVEVGNQAWSLECSRSGTDGADWEATAIELEKVNGTWQPSAKTSEPIRAKWGDPSGDCPGAFFSIKRNLDELTMQFGCAEQRIVKNLTSNITTAEAKLWLFVKSQRGVFRDLKMY